jgi:hypothetical protein
VFPNWKEFEMTKVKIPTLQQRKLDRLKMAIDEVLPLVEKGGAFDLVGVARSLSGDACRNLKWLRNAVTALENGTPKKRKLTPAEEMDVVLCKNCDHAHDEHDRYGTCETCAECTGWEG